MAKMKLNSCAGVKEGVRWGYALGWYWEFLQLDQDEHLAKLKFLSKYNFKCTHIGLNEVDKFSDSKKDAIFSYLAENDLDLMPSVGFNYIKSTGDEAKAQTESQLKLLEKYAPLLRNRICHTGLSASNRFEVGMPVEQALDIISEKMGYLAEGCAHVGTPLCAENHGDYYVSDIVKLCQITPHFYLFLDTGNTYLLGEKPIDAFYAAAPYTVGTHFKDQRVKPVPNPGPGRSLYFEVGNSDLGGGDALLRECWGILRKYAPFPNHLSMFFEMFPPPGMDPMTCLNNSINFVKSLEGSNL